MNVIEVASDSIKTPEKFIHLLYAPTNFCNMSCQYCYLGTGTDEKTDTSKAVDTLQFALNAFLKKGITPFNISFHGGEATAIPQQILVSLFDMVEQYYREYGKKIKASGFPLNPLHIKTNLYNFDKLYEHFVRYEVSVSGSVDLPLSLHDKYRLDKRGKSTLNKIKRNLALLAKYPHHKKISCVMTREHLDHMDAFVQDIKTLHYDIGLDMTKFNIMFGFDSDKNTEKFDGKIAGTDMLSGAEQLQIYHRLKDEFQNTELEKGLKLHWFKEFTPEFCCSAINCGDKFFLLQSNGDVYACPRGQASTKFRYGNVFDDEVDAILVNGWKTIEILENKKDPSPECYTCEYLPHCHQGCIFVREETGLQKSYTCDLQKAIYRDDPKKYPAFDEDYIRSYSKRYQFRNNVQAITIMDNDIEKKRPKNPELYEEKNALLEIIKSDASLQAIYSKTAFKVIVDGRSFALQSPLLSTRRDLIPINSNSKVELVIEKSLFTHECKELVNNHLLMMLLRNTMVQYGDEQREKQEHIIDHALYYQSVVNQHRNQVEEHFAENESEDFLSIDLAPLLAQWRFHFLPGVRNNLYFSTKTLREYHYQKQKKNAFYHIQAINLPFPFLEFYWSDEEDGKD